jgi:PilZ domain
LNDGENCTVLIAPPNLQATLKSQSFQSDGEVLTFSDTDALRALEVISRRRPRVVALERLFAATPRGAALINRIKTDPTLIRSEIRVVSDAGPAALEHAPVAAPASDADTAVPAAPLRAPLDPVGTRRAPRHALIAGLDIDVNGFTARLVEISAGGAQVLSPTILKPRQRVRMTLTDDQGAVRCLGVVTYAAYEMPANASPCYRAGIAFIEADRAAVDDFCVRHTAS